MSCNKGDRMEEYVYKNGTKLRRGFTTGSCAAAAAKCAVGLLLGLCREMKEENEGKTCVFVPLHLPKGEVVTLSAEVLKEKEDEVCCGVKKDAGSDADVTDGLMICVRVARSKTGITIDGGEGVGRVTRPGLDQPVGAAAVNRVPRQMIEEVLKEAAEQAGYTGGLFATVYVPGGEKAAEKTFNPNLGIVGGISILGTSGIVEPMSEQAIVATIETEMRMRAAEGVKDLILTPGNYGADFIKERMGLQLSDYVKCSNFIGESLDTAASLEIRHLLLVGHIGKLVKIGSGIMNTHSRFADGRMETMAACVLLTKGRYQRPKEETARAVLLANTTEEAIEILRDAGCLSETMEILADRIESRLARHVYGRVDTGVVFFSMQSGLCVTGRNAERMFEDGIFCRGGIGCA